MLKDSSRAEHERNLIAHAQSVSPQELFRQDHGLRVVQQGQNFAAVLRPLASAVRNT